MANSFYKLGLQKFLEGAIAILTDTIKAALASNAYTPNTTTHQWWSDVSANVVGTPQTIGSKTSTNGVFAGANVTYTAVAGGSTVNYIVIYKDTGVAGTSALICIFDTATGLPVTTNGGDITIAWDTGANKIFAI